LISAQAYMDEQDGIIKSIKSNIRDIHLPGKNDEDNRIFLNWVFREIEKPEK
jgi:hypothetical protein